MRDLSNLTKTTHPVSAKTTKTTGWRHLIHANWSALFFYCHLLDIYLVAHVAITNKKKPEVAAVNKISQGFM